MVDVGALAARGSRVIAEAVAVLEDRARYGAPSQLVRFPPSYRRRFFGAFGAVSEWSLLSEGSRYMVAAVEWEVAVVKRYVRRFDVLPPRLVGELLDGPDGEVEG